MYSKGFKLWRKWGKRRSVPNEWRSSTFSFSGGISFSFTSLSSKVALKRMKGILYAVRMPFFATLTYHKWSYCPPNISGDSVRSNMPPTMHSRRVDMREIFPTSSSITLVISITKDSINQSTNQSINQEPTNQSINRGGFTQVGFAPQQQWPCEVHDARWRKTRTGLNLKNEVKSQE